jgi:hypothetical protein
VVEAGTLKKGGVAKLAADDNSYYEVNSTKSGTRTTAWYGSFPGVPNGLNDLKVTYKGKSSKACSQTVSIWSWASGTWIQLDSRSVGSSEQLVEKMPTGALADYVSGSSGDGVLQVRVYCASSASNFGSKADLMKIAYTKS